MKKGFWIALWMVAFALAGILTLLKIESFMTSRDIGDYHRTAYEWFEFILPFAVMAFVGLVGHGQIPPSPLSRKHQNLVRIGHAYGNAVRILLTQRWLWLMFALIAVANLVAEFADFAFRDWMRAQAHLPDALTQGRAMGTPAHAPIMGGGWGDLTAVSVRQALHYPLDIMDSFVPHLRLSSTWGGMVLYSTLVLVAAIIFSGKLRRLSDERDYQKPANLIGAIALPLAVLTLGVMVFDVREGLLLSARLAAAAVHGQSDVFGGRFQPTPIEIIENPLRMLFLALTAGFLIAGLAASLNRVARKERTTAGSFFGDSVRYFIPVAGTLLLLELSRAVLQDLSYPWIHATPRVFFGIILSALQIVLPFFMLCPFAGVIHNVGTIQAFRLGVRDWLSHAWDAVVFLSLGYSFVAIVLAIQWTIARSFDPPPTIWGRVAAEAPVIAMRLALGIFLCVAIWEFYQQIIPIKSGGSE